MELLRFSISALVLAALGHSSIASSASAACTGPRRGEGKIVGGTVAQLANWPGQAVLRARDPAGPETYYFCGGSLITQQSVLTAAHCIDNVKRGQDGVHRRPDGWIVEIVMGRDDLRKTGTSNVRQVQAIVPHESYQSAGAGDDVAVIQLAQPWNGELARLSLQANTDPGAGHLVMVAGFGVQKNRGNLQRFQHETGTAFYAGSERLLEVSVPVVGGLACRQVYSGSKIGSGQICAGYEQGERDSCQADSGGPLVAFDKEGCPYQVGVVSWGDGCAQQKAYGVYTRISAYANWLRPKVRDAMNVLKEEKISSPETSPLVGEAMAQLTKLLGAADGRANLSVKGGSRIRLGDHGEFHITSKVAGRLILIDINAKGEVIQLFPNKHTSARELSADKLFKVPDNGLYRFPAQEPIGKGLLVAIVAPASFKASVVEVDADGRPKGFRIETVSYWMNLLQRIRSALGQRGFTVAAIGQPVTPEAELGEWALGSIEYEIIR